jgi:hypothetical protein
MSKAKSSPAALDDRQVIGRDAAGGQTRIQREQAKAATQFKQAKGNSQLTMHVKIYSPFRDYYDSEAFSITAKNTTGPFDILPRHHNFISLLSACELLIRSADGSEQKIVISGGIMHVKADQVIVFLDV